MALVQFRSKSRAGEVGNAPDQFVARNQHRRGAAMSPKAAKVAIKMTTAINLVVYNFWATAIMILIHAGFLMGEMDVSRVKHALAPHT